MVKKQKTNNRLYTVHGAKRAQGIPSEINGKKALASFEGDRIVGYTTLEELQEAFYTRKLPKYSLDF